jgi:hypothetical protein
MDIFYIIVLSIAIILLILLLTYIGIQMNSAGTKTAPYPPTKSTCPDYWTIDSDGKCNVPTTGRNTSSKTLTTANTKGYTPTSNGSPATIDFSNKDWSSGSGSALCGQKLWANTNGIMWDGVSNYNGCP